jgi:tRNA (guanosine-2'-O-)-methyltransferase
MDPATPVNKELLKFLQKHMTPERVQRFEEVLRFRTRHIAIAAEDIYQERNASALIRTADCFGIQDVHIIENYNQYKVSTQLAGGADKWVDVHLYTGPSDNTMKCIEALRGNGYRIIASTPNKEDKTPDSLDITDKIAVFLGGEKEGISQTIIDNADGFLRIPMVGFTESFNLSVAGSLILYSLTNRLHRSDINWQLTEEEKDELRISWAMKSIHSAGQLVKKFLNS